MHRPHCRTCSQAPVEPAEPSELHFHWNQFSFLLRFAFTSFAVDVLAHQDDPKRRIRNYNYKFSYNAIRIIGIRLSKFSGALNFIAQKVSETAHWWRTPGELEERLDVLERLEQLEELEELEWKSLEEQLVKSANRADSPTPLLTMKTSHQHPEPTLVKATHSHSNLLF